MRMRKMGKSSSSTQVVVVTVHGTNDGPTPEGPKKWFEDGSDFSQLLKQALSRQEIQIEIVPHIWSGENSARAREQGAEKLAGKIRGLGRAGKRVHLIGHSHGGNVAVDAACALNWEGSHGRPKIASITTVGTPFFHARVSRVAAFAGLAFFWIIGLSVVALLASVPLLIERGHQNPASLWTIPIAGISMAAVLLLAMPMAWSGLRRIQRISRKRNEHAQIHSIWHENDEAINFLQRVEKVDLAPFPKWSLWRSSQTFAISLAVTAGLGSLLLVSVIWVVAQSGKEVGAAFWLPFLLFIGFWPLAFAVTYILARVLLGFIPEVCLRAGLNKTVSNILVGMSFGRDGDEKIGNVSTTSAYFGAVPVVIEGALKERMQAAAAAAADKLIAKYRWTLFSPEGDTSSILKGLTGDVMTWKSLIHTTYFDQPEVATIAAEYIANCEKAI
jgi:hypothetical protein